MTKPMAGVLLPQTHSNGSQANIFAQLQTVRTTQDGFMCRSPKGANLQPEANQDLLIRRDAHAPQAVIAMDRAEDGIASPLAEISATDRK